MSTASQRKTNGLNSKANFRKKAINAIDVVEADVRRFLAGSGPTRRRPRVSVSAIARIAKVDRTTFRLPYHQDLKRRIDELKQLVRGPSKTDRQTRPGKRNRTERPKQKDLITQLGVTAQLLVESQRENAELKRNATKPSNLLGIASGMLQDDQIVKLIESLLARRNAKSESRPTHG